MKPRPSQLQTLPLAVHRQIDQYCLAYEQKLQQGKRPDLSKAVYRQKPAVQGPLLTELLAVELQWRVSHGQAPKAADYLAAFPDYAEIVRSVCRRVLGPAEGVTLSFAADADTHDLLVRCPDCHARISPGDGDLRKEITCNKCGGIFRLANQQAAWAKVGARLGPFELLQELGAGAFGTVWRARDTRLDRLVAIKVPRRALLEDEEFEKFMREARAAAQLAHPHIVQVHEVGRLDDVIYIVSDYIDGWTLADWLEGQRLTVREAVELAIPIAEALAHAHDCGVIHRDLKPANILIDRKGQPHLTDFGLARREAGEVTITIEGQLLGTPAYMSPEQAGGGGHAADRRTDVYSFGVLLFELFTGELPFRGSLRVLLRQVVEEEPPSPRRFNGRLPRDLETIVLKCLEKEPARRYSTATAVCDDLKCFLRHLPISARPIGRWERLRRWSRRNPVIAASALVVLLTLTAATAISSAFAVTASRSSRLAQQNEEAATVQEGLAKDAAERAEERSRYAAEQERLAKEAEKLAEERLAYAQRQQTAATASAALAERRLQEVERTTYNLRLNAMNMEVQPNNLRQLIPLGSARYPERMRDFAWRYCAWVAGRDLEAAVTLSKQQLPAHHFDNNVFRAIALTPTGDMLAVADKTHRIVLYDWETRTSIRALKHHEDSLNFVTFSPDGRQLAAGDANGHLSLWDVRSGDQLLSHEFSAAVRSLAFSPDGTRLAVGLAFTGDASPLWMIDDQLRISAMKAATPGPLQALHWTRDGQWLAAGTRNEANNFFVLDVRSQKPVMVLPGGSPNELLYDIAVSPTGATAAIACRRSVNVWNLESREQITSLPTKGHRVQFSGDGRSLAIVAPDGVRVYDASSWKPVQQFRLDASPYPFLFFSPGDVSLVCGASSGRLYQWRAAANGAPAACAMEGATREYALAALTGDRVVTASMSGPRTLRIRDCKTGALVRTLYQASPPETESHFMAPGSVAISESDGQAFVICSREQFRCLDLSTGEVQWERRFPINGSAWLQLFSCCRMKVRERSLCALVVPSVAVPGSSRASSSEILLLDAQTGEDLGRLDQVTKHNAALAHAPGRGIIVGRSEDGEITVWNDSTFQKIATVACPTSHRSCDSLAFSPDESQLVVADDTGPLYRLNPDTWKIEASNQSISLAAEQLIFTPGGDTLLMGGEGEILMFDPITLESRGRIQADFNMYRMAFDEQADLIVTRGGTHLVRWPIASYAGVATEALAAQK